MADSDWHNIYSGEEPERGGLSAHRKNWNLSRVLNRPGLAKSPRRLPPRWGGVIRRVPLGSLRLTSQFSPRNQRPALRGGSCAGHRCVATCLWAASTPYPIPVRCRVFAAPEKAFQRAGRNGPSAPLDRPNPKLSCTQSGHHQRVNAAFGLFRQSPGRASTSASRRNAAARP